MGDKSMRACSFLPASTRMIYELGLEDRLYGVTFECASDKPKVVRSKLEGRTLTSAEIDRLVADTAARGETLYYLDDDLLEAAAPDVIFTQHVCDVCQIGTSYVERAAAKLPKPPRIVPLVPRRLADVFGNVGTIAGEMGAPERAAALVARANERIDRVVDALRAARARPTRVMVMEWLDPIYNCGHWIPDQIALSGGSDALSAPGGYSVAIDWEKVRLYDPEVLVVAPCGFDVERASQEIGRLTERPGFSELAAARHGRVFVADANLFTQPSVTQLTSGIELLAHLFHPAIFAASPEWQAFFARAA
jgi:iron complex transport system substrate-binding protein